MPSWLSINPTTGIFSGVVPDNTTKSVLPLTVTATDSSGLSASETFNVTVYADPLVKQTPAATWKIGQVVTLATSFSDPNALTLAYSAIMADGSAVPSWLHVNAATGAISGTVAAGTASFALNVTATDSVGLSANETINVTILNPPVVTTTVAQTMAVYGQTATLALPQTTFVDPQHQAMTYAATLSSGAPLPGIVPSRVEIRSAGVTV